MGFAQAINLVTTRDSAQMHAHTTMSTCIERAISADRIQIRARVVTIHAISLEYLTIGQ